jgi:hypothetical protein
MDGQSARVIPWSGKAVSAREDSSALDAVRAEEPRLQPLDELIVVLGDEQLEALAAAFLMHPARKAMTFEAYLAVRGFARRVSSG